MRGVAAQRLAVCCGLLTLMLAVSVRPAAADGDAVDGRVETIDEGVRVTLLRSGGVYEVSDVRGGNGGSGGPGCTFTLVFAPALEDVPYGVSAGPKPHPDAQFAVLLCDGAIYRYLWISPEDVIDLDAIARDEAERYVEEVLVPQISVRANPDARGLVGLPSWFWVEGFGGTLSAPPISAFGMTIEVRMASGSVTWDFGDGTVVEGDLGRPYPEESSVQHVHQRSGTYAVAADVQLLPEYRVDGGPWLTLPALSASATLAHPVEERQAVITHR